VCQSAAKEPNEISSSEFKRQIKALIRNEFLQTYKRRCSQKTLGTVEKYKNPCSRTVTRYLNVFSLNLLKSF
jgi:hypothetical protein